jgi:hypothetical protein
MFVTQLCVCQLTLCRPTEPPVHISLAAIYIRLLVQSHLLAVHLIRELEILNTMQDTYNALVPSNFSSEARNALYSAIDAVQQTAETNTILGSQRFNIPEDAQWAESLLSMKNSYSWHLR